MSNTVGFPGLGIGEFDLNSTAFTITLSDKIQIPVAWYGIIITFGMLLAVLYIYLHSKRDKLLSDDLIDVAFVTIIAAIIGARLYYVLFDYFDNPQRYTDFLNVIDMRKGGLAIYGGVILGGIGCVCMLLIKKMNVLKFLDNLVPGLMIAQAIGRWGNFVNAEAHGGETTLPWGMTINGDGPYHPTFLYESLWNVIGFILIDRVVLKHKKYDGESLIFYFTWYGLGRMFIEGLRTDSLYIGGTNIRVSQLIAAVCFFAGTFLLVFFRVGKIKLPTGDCIYLPTSKKYAVVNGAQDEKNAGSDKANDQNKEKNTEDIEEPKAEDDVDDASDKDGEDIAADSDSATNEEDKSEEVKKDEHDN